MPSQITGEVKTWMKMWGRSGNVRSVIAPTLFIPLLRRAFPRGPKVTINRIITRVLKCRGEDFMRRGARGRGRMGISEERASGTILIYSIVGAYFS